MQADQEIVLKLLFVGSSVGKSSLILRYCNDEFKEDFFPTIGVDFKLKQLEFNGKAIKLQIWDTAGQERFMTIVSSYYKGAHGFFIVYDVTNKQSFEEVAKWVDQLKIDTNPDVPKILIGNKSDLNGAREVTPEEGQQLANTLGVQYIETSAKEGFNVEHAFQTLLAEVYARHEKEEKEKESQKQ
ncbi:unnamed protein product (macronuclear) [Paramecium tetraurelia]|uniref:Chromosome undetermined scaffold_24, whole genome shotgun sequence n=1 Tax=Paramecium tetraurelia TaxID=5888 RepID=Q3SDQ0_PARTE|nr:uncharacterized protein GSPATT00009282001 [Paramecium tetraurelia]CAI39308.1 rab_C36 [Paramecium tetraurelia]CAK72934.1 unnamed protein product [Paramecium tetraurelia]|eukprot:XP_001440331.1 hypothetical protein (macronuclear) [Paramecium tetraurelia strain d4-2]